LEHEVSKIYRDHEDLVNSSERRERLERAARNRLQSDCRRFQELNRALRDQVEVLQQQLLVHPDQMGRSQHNTLITQLVTQSRFIYKNYIYK
jgi:angiomotin like